ncbi:hypothetical protein BDY19DRAFT_743469 [Irpex rosettiformis]|uniref:Uncharacterized protein n=1 Tax=Irpex rosettiformis TaxID=378272 RepID=A0ACB8U9E0_9APHY|nr:hypothetical protein BDY19DRAFT_743469 [Irpex rosettiformis]
MIKELEEFYIEDTWKLDHRAAIPHLRKPYPVLKLQVPKDDHIGDYLFNEQIVDFNLAWTSCPVGPLTYFEARRQVSEDAEKKVVVSNDNNMPLANPASPQISKVKDGQETQAVASLDTYRPLERVKKNNNPNIYAYQKQSDYKRQGRTADLPAYCSTYHYKSYATPYPLASPPRNSPFSVEDIPKLQEAIPDAFMPDFLLVHDPHNVTFCRGFNTIEDNLHLTVPPPRKYQRIFPKISRTDLDIPEVCKARDTISHLYLHQKNRLGVGHHSLVYRVPFSLPPPLSAHSRNGKVMVTAKLAMYTTEDRHMLLNEARVYDELPKHMSEDWCGYNFIPPILQSVPVDPVVPKFYGFYKQVKEDGTFDGQRSPILLMEECGRPIKPEELNMDQRTECISLLLRLHLENFFHGSFWVRNILRQPGPLYRPPEERSDDTPSFRLIDLGRASHIRPVRDGKQLPSEVMVDIYNELEEAKKEILYRPPGHEW